MYTVIHSGYRAECVSPSGETLYTAGLYCRGDRYLLENTLEARVKDGTILSYKIEWVTEERRA